MFKGNPKIKFLPSLSWIALGLVLVLTVGIKVSHATTIVFQDDTFATINSDNLIIDNNDTNAGNIAVQFGKTLSKTLLYSQSNSRFELNAGLDLNNFQLSTARVENVAAMPGGAGGLGAGGTGRIVELTATDSIAPGCTGPSCPSGTYSWNGAIWKPLQGSVTASTATKIVTVGPTGRDYTTIALAATYCNTLSGCEMWIDPGIYPVTTVVDLENTKLIGASGNGITQISISGSGKLMVKDTFFEELNINVGAISGTIGLDVKYNAASSSSVLFSKVNFSTTTGKYILGSTAGTPPTTFINFMHCAEAAADPGAFINTKASAGLNSATSAIYVINLLTKDPLKISDWPVSIVGGSNVVTSGTIISVPDRTISVSPDMDINNAIQSLVSSGGGGVVKLLVGTHTINSPIIVNSNNIAIVGEGPGTIINVPSAGWTGGTGATVAALQVGAAAGTAPVTNVIIRDFTLQVGPDIHGIKINGGSENKVLDTVVKSTGAKSTTHSAIVFTDSTAPAAAPGVRLTASRNIVNRDDSISTPSCVTGGNHCWIDGVHFDGDNPGGPLAGQIFGYGNGLRDSIISENIVNEVQQTTYVFSDVSASGIFSNRSRNIGFNAGGTPFGLFLNNSNDVSVINNTVETNNYTGTVGITLYSNVQASTIIGNTINNGGGVNTFAIGIDVTGSTASNDNVITSNEINGAVTGIHIGATNLRNIVSSNKYINVGTNITDLGSYTKLETLHHQDTVNPTVNDDITRDYRVGTMWVNTSTNATFINTNATAGAAVWFAFHAQNTDTGTNSTTFRLNNAGDSGLTDSTLAFGLTAPQTLTWNHTNLRFDLSKDLNITGNLTVSGNTLLGATGIGNTDLDVNGDEALRGNNITVANGTNNNVVIGAFSNIRLVGPTAAFTITGVAGGVNGKKLILTNTTAQSMIIANNSSSSLAANRILTSSGSDASISGNSALTFIYDSTISEWIQTDQVSLGGPFGDGHDGDVTISGATTLTQDMMYHNLTIGAAGVLNTGGYRVFVTGTLAIAAGGNINNNGGAGGNGAGGTGAAGGAAGAAITRTPFRTASSAGGAGANAPGGTGTNNGAGGAAPTDVLTSIALYPQNFLAGCGGGGGGSRGNTGVAGSAGVNCLAGALGGAGGTAGGSGNNAESGGGGGGGGGVILLYANTINNAGTIQANGGTGGNGGTSGTGLGGNGGGGGGGAVILYYRATTGSGIGTLQANGGAAGTGGNGGSAGAAGSTFSTQT